jgi:hypothetical protein
MNEFKNNRKFYDVEEWKEYSDGKIIKKRLNDNGYGKTVRAETGKKLHPDKMKNLRREVGHKAHLGEYYLNEEGLKLKSLQEYLDKPDQILEYEYLNQIIDDIGSGMLTEIKQGRTFERQDEQGFEDFGEDGGESKTRSGWKEVWYNRV